MTCPWHGTAPVAGQTPQGAPAAWVCRAKRPAEPTPPRVEAPQAGRTLHS